MQNAEDFLDLPLEDFYAHLAATTMSDRDDLGLDITPSSIPRPEPVSEDQFIVDDFGNPVLMDNDEVFHLLNFCLKNYKINLNSDQNDDNEIDFSTMKLEQAVVEMVEQPPVDVLAVQ